MSLPEIQCSAALFCRSAAFSCPSEESLRLVFELRKV